MVGTRAWRSPMFWGFGILLGAGMAEAIRRAWVCDDVFISLRYIQNLFAGHGLVFNAGERVEGYTHFLWVMIFAALHRFGADLVWLAQHLSLVAFALVLLTLWRRPAQGRAGAAWGLPIAAVVAAFHLDMQIYASSGLETMPFALALLWGVLVTADGRRRWGLAAALYALATLLRPEGVLYTVAAGMFILWRARRLAPLARFAGIWLLLVLPSQVFRLVYYGDPLPNTFYAKFGGSTNWEQGWKYTTLYFEIYPILLLGALAVLLVLLVALGRVGRRGADARAPGTDIAVLAGIHVLLNAFYVTRLGGDFMFARFFIPVTPLMLLVVEEAVAWPRRRSVELVALVVLLTGILVARGPHADMLGGRQRAHGIVNEFNFYPDDYIQVLRRQGEVLGRALAGTDAGVGLLAGQDAMAYFGELRYALEPHGLTDRELARKPVVERGRPGHERTATLEDLLLRRVQFRLRYGFMVNLPLERQIRFDDLYGEIVYYDRDIMRQLRGRPGINFLEYPEHLRQELQQLEGRPERLAEDYRRAQLFYFIHNDDPQLLQEYRQALRAHGVPGEVLEDIDRMAAAFGERMQQQDLRPRPTPGPGRPR